MAIKQRSKSLQSRGEQLADTFFQLKVLNGTAHTHDKFTAFADKINDAGYEKGLLQPNNIDVFQLNITKQCNQS